MEIKMLLEFLKEVMLLDFCWFFRLLFWIFIDMRCRRNRCGNKEIISVFERDDVVVVGRVFLWKVNLKFLW